MQDYNLAVTADRHQETVRFWRRQLASAGGGFRWQATAEALASQTNGGRAAGGADEAGAGLATHTVTLSPQAGSVLARFAADDLGRFTVMTAALAYVLARYFQQSPVIVKTPPLAGAATETAEAATAAMSATVPLIVAVQEDWTVAEYLRECSRVVAATYSFAGFPLTAFLERDYRLEARQMTNVTLWDTRLHGEAPPPRDEAVAEEIGISLHLASHLASQKDGADRVQIRYRAERVEAFLVSGFARHLVNALEQFDNTRRRLQAIELLGEAERQQLVISFNAPAVTRREAALEAASDAASDAATVVTLFEEQVERAPAATALMYQERVVTYEDLNAQANRLARHLRRLFESDAATAMPAMPEQRVVGILAERSPELIVAVLAVLKAGAAYLPIDPDYPAERIRYLLDDAGVAVLLTQSEYLWELQDFGGQMFALDLQLAGLTTAADNLADNFADNFADNLDAKPRPQQAAYLLYTSGSTGKPKGCVIEHRNLSNYLRWATAYYFVGESTEDSESVGNFGLYSSLSFDFTVTNLFCPLLRGKSLFIFEQGAEIHHILAQAFDAASPAGAAIDTMKLTPSHIRLLEEVRGKRTNIRKVIAGGEELRPAHIRTLRRLNPQMEIYNEYGPTEATVGCIVEPLPPTVREAGCEAVGEVAGAEVGEVLIGKPITNTQVYVLDRRWRLAPVGVRGEICIAGEGVARGYHRRADLTAEKFIPNPFAKGERLYRTGDLGRWLPDGRLQCFGRTDNQVKIRGHRVELGEVENYLTAHAEVREAVVLAREDYPGEKRLVAYVVAKASPASPTSQTSQTSLTGAALREFAAAGLPQAMTPAHFVFLEQLPLTTNGKVDKRALPAPETVAAADDRLPAAPTTVDEEEMLRIWQEVLRREHLGIHDNFFEMGGDSLTAVQVISRVWERFGVTLQIDEVFEAPTLQALAARLRAAPPMLEATAKRTMANNELPALAPVSRQAALPLSFAQQRLWFLAHLEGRTATYNVAHALLLEGALDIAALQKSLDALIERHEVLRTNLVERDGLPWQRVRDEWAFALEQLSLAEGDRQSQLREAQAEADKRAALPFDLQNDLLVRAALLRLDEEAQVLVVVMHHIIWDAWSADIFNRELTELYHAFANGAPPQLAPLAVQYADFADWQRQRLLPHVRETQLPYWVEKLAGAPPLLDLGSGRARPAVQRYEGAKESFEIDAALAEELRRVAQQHGATLFMTLLAAYAVVLYRHSAQADMVIGTPAASRTRRELEPLIGFFVNLLGLRLRFDDDATLGEFLRQVKRVAVEAYRYQDTPFDLLVETLQPQRSLSHHPIFQVSFALVESRAAAIELADLRVTPIEVPATPARFDLELAIERVEDRLVATFVYDRDLFDAVTVSEMREHYLGALRALAANAEQRLSDLSLLNDSQWQTLLETRRQARQTEQPLPTNAASQRSGYVAPRNAVEETLTHIWAEVLRQPQVCIYDNFFELGGDSILSIQVISRAAKSGIGLTTRQMFQHQTIAELAQVAGGRRVEAEQGQVHGAIPLTPIQHWFFEQATDARLYFNQSVLLETPPDLQAAALDKALDALLAHHDMLRAALREEEAAGFAEKVWSQTVGDEAQQWELQTIDLSDFPDDLRAAVLEDSCQRLQASLDISKPPLARAAYFDYGEGEAGRLFLVAHHLVMDGVSWRILLEDLLALTEHLRRGDAAALPAKTTSFQTWSTKLQALATSQELAKELAYWTTPARALVKPLPLDVPFDTTTDAPGNAKANSVASAATCKFTLHAAATRRLLEGAARRDGAQANEVLLAALLVALKAWTGEAALLVDLEGHGREELFEDVDVSRTVGWFTTVFPVLFAATGKTPAAILQQVKEQLRAVPGRGIGYGLLRYGSEDADVRAQLRALPQAQIAFNYLGQTDATLPSASGFRPATEAYGADQHPERQRAHLFEINAIISGGELQLDWVYGSGLHHKETVARLVKIFGDALDALLAEDAATDQATTNAGIPAALLAAEPGLDAEAIADVYALSPLQAGMLFRGILEPQSTAYFEQLSCEIHGALDVERFRRAWQAVVARHDVLRTAFFWERLAAPLQVVFRDVELPWEFHDWQGIEDERQRAAFEQFLAEDRLRKFDLRVAPALRLTLLQFAADRYGFCWSHHHILLDGWSVANLLQEVLAFYRREGGATLPPVKPYRAYIDWLQEQSPPAAEAFWRDHLRGFALPTALPFDASPAALSKTLPATALASSRQRFDKAELRLSADFTERLRRLAQQQHITLNTLMRGVWALLLSRYGDSADVCFGVTVAGRPPTLAGIEEMAGLFINTLPLRLCLPQRMTQQMTMTAWLQELQNLHAALDSFAHSDLADLQRYAEIPPEARLFDSLLVFENYPVEQSLEQEIGGLTFERAEAFEQTEYALTLAVVPERELYLRLRYDTQRFASATVRRILAHLQTALAAFVANPQQTPAEVEILSLAERRQLERLSYGNAAALAATVETRPATTREIAPASGQSKRHETTLAELLTRQAAQTPAARAVECGDQSLSFAELDRRANQLANLLVARGVGADVPVALFFERSIDMIVALCGVLKAGGAYLPLEVAYPPERLRLMLDDARAPLVLTEERLLSKLPASAAATLCLDSDRETIARQSSRSPAPRNHPDHLAYVIYTSGTTGRPKGVAITHRSVINLLYGLQQTVYRDADGSRLRVGVNGSLAFDTSVKQVMQLLNGQTLVVIPEVTRTNPAALVEWARRAALDALDCTPSHLELLLENGLLDDADKPAVGRVLVGGEAISQTLWSRLAASRTTQFYNLYGPTETTVDATVANISDAPAAPAAPIAPTLGAPLDNVRVYVLDSRLRQVPIGVAGELYIGGAGVARGYLHDAALSAARFLPDPFGGAAGARMYRTGDVVKWREVSDAGGKLEFLGRQDAQLKVRGFRIEPREIESLLESHTAIAQAVVLPFAEADAATPANQQLVAYFVKRAGADIEAIEALELRDFLKNHLPEFMIPGIFLELESLPLTAHGKLDYGALPAPVAASRTPAASYVPPRDAVERQLVDIWQQTLGVRDLGIMDDFFALGGHSILAMKLVGRLQAAFGVALPLAQLFEAPTIERLAAHLRAPQAAGEWATLVPMQRGALDGAPIFLLPGAGGNLLSYYELAKALGGKRPVYGLQSVGLDGVTAPLTSVEEIARHHLEQVRAVAPAGPYLFIGHSFGGKVAFEMSQQLAAAGLQVGLVALLDTPAPVFERSAARRDWDAARWLAQIVREIEEFLRLDLALTYDQLATLAEAEQLDAVLTRLEQTGWWTPGAGRAQLRGHLEVYRTNYQMDYQVREPFYPVPLLLCKASDEEDEGDEGATASLQAVRQQRDWGWQRFSSAPVKVFDVPGNHLTMLADAGVTAIAEHLTAFLTKAEIDHR